MQSLLKLSKGIDWLSTSVGKLGMWMILATTLVSAGNAIVRKAFNTSSNALLEVQWYLFAGVFMLSAGYCLLKNAHVRIDFISFAAECPARATGSTCWELCSSCSRFATSASAWAGPCSRRRWRRAKCRRTRAD